MRFPNVTADTPDSIYRRSRVINLQARFAHPAEYNLLRNEEKANLGIFPRGDALRDFLAIGPAGAVFFRIFLDFILNNRPLQCQERIETYDRNEGCTYRVMRFACNLPSTSPIVAVVQEIFGRSQHRKPL